MGFSPSRSVPDSEYLLTRSTTQATLAARAPTEQAAAAHRRIASCYLDKLFADEYSPSPDVVIAPRTILPTTDGEVGAAELRFYDVTTPQENDELNALLQHLP